MKRAIMLALFALSACGAETAVSDDTSHVLTVDGTQYDSYQESGDSIHWLTPGGDVESASFAERSQTWDGNGSDNLPCDGQLHWVSTPNVLTISDCISTSTTSSTSTTTSTSTSSTSTTQPSPPPPPPSSTTVASTSSTTSTIASTSSTSTTTSTTLSISPAAPTTTVANGLPVTK